MRNATAVPLPAAVLAALALLGGCEGGSDEVAAEQPRERRETAFDGQLRALG